MFCWPVSDVSVLDPVKVACLLRPRLWHVCCVAIWTWKHDSTALTVSVASQCHDNPSLHISPSHQARYVVSKYSEYLEAGKWQWQWPELLLTSVTRSTVQTLHYITQVNWPGSCDKWTTERWGQRFTGKTSYNFEYINLSRLSKSSKKSEY